MKNIDAQTGPLRLPDSGGLAGPAWRSFVRPALERLLGLRQLQHLYERIRTDEGSGGFWARALRQMEARVAPSGAPLQAAIGDGGAIVVASGTYVLHREAQIARAGKERADAPAREK